jgi:CheY-like chemotaxis protein
LGERNIAVMVIMRKADKLRHAALVEGKMKKVLVIDDCEDFRAMVQDLLKDAGYEVELAEGAEDALMCCERNSFDLIICDLVLPMTEEESDVFEDENDSVMVGVHAIQTMSQKYPQTPIIAISGAMTGTPLQAMARFGAVGCLSKPCNREQLLAAVESALDSR